ncbi:hypothetical protein, partial [Aeromonas media]|uniref:hypothetical protein n=1 Tax=Aeromonas media TaxID=651 RepID=UPI0038D177BA
AIMPVMFFIPSFIFVFFNQYSLTSGVILSQFIVLSLTANRIPRIGISKAGFIYILAGVLVMACQAGYILITANETKPLISIVAMIALSAPIIFLSCFLSTMNTNDLSRVAMYFCVIIIVLGWVSILSPIAIGSYAHKIKPVFPFSEPSHYALVLGFLFCTFGYYSSKKLKLFVLLNMLSQAALLPNLTLIVFVFIAMLIFWGGKGLMSIIFISVTLLILFYSSILFLEGTEVGSYILSRVVLNNSTDNLTALVFLQGIDDAKRALIETHGVGLGFQMAGTNTIGEYGYRIWMLSGMEINRLDGGFLASKIVSEFGVLGVVFLALYIKGVLKSLISLKGATSSDDEMRRLMVIYACAVISLLVEIFLRGFGYFSPTILMFIALYLMKKIKERELAHARNLHCSSAHR